MHSNTPVQIPRGDQDSEYVPGTKTELEIFEPSFEEETTLGASECEGGAKYNDRHLPVLLAKNLLPDTTKEATVEESASGLVLSHGVPFEDMGNHERVEASERVHLEDPKRDDHLAAEALKAEEITMFHELEKYVQL